MVNPGAFQGTRHSFLMAQKPTYTVAVAGNYAGDFLADIQRQYFKRYPIDLDHCMEPSPEHLAAVDDDAADPEPLSPNPDGMSGEGFLLAVKAFEALRKVVEFCKEVCDKCIRCVCCHVPV
jgi:hypothetical protein